MQDSSLHKMTLKLRVGTMHSTNVSARILNALPTKQKQKARANHMINYNMFSTKTC